MKLLLTLGLVAIVIGVVVIGSTNHLDGPARALICLGTSTAGMSTGRAFAVLSRRHDRRSDS